MQTTTAFRRFLERLVKEPERLVLVGVIVRIDADRGFGFIRAPGRRDTFFNSCRVAENDFGRLRVG
jgi:hypothetical protein